MTVRFLFLFIMVPLVFFSQENRPTRKKLNDSIRKCDDIERCFPIDTSLITFKVKSFAIKCQDIKTGKHTLKNITYRELYYDNKSWHWFISEPKFRKSEVTQGSFDSEFINGQVINSLLFSKHIYCYQNGYLNAVIHTNKKGTRIKSYISFDGIINNQNLSFPCSEYYNFWGDVKASYKIFFVNGIEQMKSIGDNSNPKLSNFFYKIGL